ncbi:MAG: ABC transporter ATP-binding protein [Promethearchaeota archaeon]
MAIPQIQVNKLTFYYKNSDRAALADINLEINEGEIICVTGSSGGGKTTLGMALSGHIPHTIAGDIWGEVIFQGVPSSDLSITDISQFIGLVQQDPENQLVTSSILEEIAFGPENLVLPRKEILQRVHNSLETMDLISLASRSTNELSGGEKQRVAIASILAMYPQVLVLDEPTSFLDVQSIKNLILTLKRLNRNRKLTIIIIEHKPYLFREIIHKLIILEQGEIVGQFSKPEINFKHLEIPRKVLTDIQQIQIKKPTESILEIHKLNVKLKNHEILRKISLQLKRGLIYAIVGPNGAGKTTLLHSFLNIIPSNGNILYDGKKISKMPVHKLARDFGLIFQNPNHQIFEKSVLNEVIFAPKNFKQPLDEVIPKAKLLLKDAILDSYIENPPFSLSYGEKRRLNICSILIYKPDLLLLDEPFIGQDRANVEYLLQLLKERKLKGGTTVIVSHRRELYDLVDYFFVLDKGELVAQGRPEEIITYLRENNIIGFVP